MPALRWYHGPSCPQWNAGPAQLLAFGSIGVELASAAEADAPVWFASVPPGIEDVSRSGVVKEAMSFHLTLRSKLGDQEDQGLYRGRMGTWNDLKCPTPATTLWPSGTH
ncbi:hypothetical protein EMCRGX_G025604 [Ephydatia muelleri]|eukprot:Em0021g407a